MNAGEFLVNQEPNQDNRDIHDSPSLENGLRPRVWGRHYRADAVFTRLNYCLRKHGVTARKPLHELRKELGALITAEHGIYAASRVLRHSSVATTAAHYSDLKNRPTIPVGAWLERENIIAVPVTAEVAAKPGSRRKQQLKTTGLTSSKIVRLTEAGSRHLG